MELANFMYVGRTCDNRPAALTAALVFAVPRGLALGNPEKRGEGARAGGAVRGPKANRR